MSWPGSRFAYLFAIRCGQGRALARSEAGVFGISFDIIRLPVQKSGFSNPKIRVSLIDIPSTGMV